MKRTLELKAPPGQFRVICVDTFEGDGWVQGDFETHSKAIDVATEIGGVMLKTHVYDDLGHHVFEAGTF